MQKFLDENVYLSNDDVGVDGGHTSCHYKRQTKETKKRFQFGFGCYCWHWLLFMVKDTSIYRLVIIKGYDTFS